MRQRGPTRLLIWLVGLTAMLIPALGCGTAPSSQVAGGPEGEGAAAPAAAGEVQAALQAMIDAWERADVEAINASFAPDAVMYGPEPPGEFRGADSIRAYTVDFFKRNAEVAIELDDLKIQTAGPVGWSTASYTLSGDGRSTVRGYLSVVWVKQPDGSYRASLMHTSRLPEAEGSS